MSKKKICSQCFRLISQDCRVKIIQRLRKKPNNVSGISRDFSLTQPTITHHLRALEKTGMVFSQKKGREIYYFLNKKYPCKKCFLFKFPLKI